MPDVQLKDAPPVPSTLLVNVDNETVFGDGSLEHPLRCTGGGTVQSVSVTGAAVSVNGSSSVSFVHPSASGPLSVVVTLDDATIDGFQKTVTLGAADAYDYTLQPTNFLSGSNVTFPATGGAALLVWSETDGGWYLVSTEGGTLNP